MIKLNYFKILNSYILIAISTLFFISCGTVPAPNRFDIKFNNTGKIKDDITNDKIKNYWKEGTRKSINKKACEHFNVIIDMSFGLNKGVESSAPLMESVLDDVIGSAHFYKVGEENDAKELNFNDKLDAFYFIQNEGNYGGKWSRLQPGIELAVKDLSKSSLFISDFLLDEGDYRPTENTSHKKVKTSAVIDYPWAKESFKKWFAAGNKLDIIVWPYEKRGIETNYYYCFFTPKDQHLNGTKFNFNEYYELAKQINEKATKISIDPLAFSYSGEEVYNYVENNNTKLYNENNIDNNYSVLQFHYNNATNEDTYKELESHSLTFNNNSPWDLTVSEQTTNISKDFCEQIGSKVETNSNWEFTYFNQNNLKLNFDLKGKSNFATTKAQKALLFVTRHDLVLNNIKMKEQFKIDAKILKCQVNCDKNFFTHEALCKNILDGLSEAQDDIQQLIQKDPLYTTYTITCIYTMK